ncbi:hypothetical protein DFS33DRAFT_36355 [Desarmillaria ectypa]|nr:hypothetical protein DFS33DRAFT_36355 [Desarmillaria ectypa]
MAGARIGQATIKRAADLRAALRRSPELKPPSSKRLQRSRAAGVAKVKTVDLEAVEESTESSTKQLAGSSTGPGASRGSEASMPRKLAPLGGGAPSISVRRSRAASAMAWPVGEGDSMAKGPPRAQALSKGKGTQKQVETLEAAGSAQSRTITKGKVKVKLIEATEESDRISAEDEERAAESDATEIVDGSENMVKIPNKKAGKREPIQPNNREDEVLDPNEIIPRMNALVKEDIADLQMIHQLQNSVNRVIKDATAILHGCRRETIFRTRLETFLRYCVFNNHPDSKNEEVTIQDKGRLDNGWTLEEMWDGGGVLIEYGPGDCRLADDEEEDELFWVLDDEELQKTIDRVLPKPDDKSEVAGEKVDGEEGDAGDEGEESDGEGMSGGEQVDEENVTHDEPASQPSSPSRKRSRDDNEEAIAHPARRIKVC